MDTFLLVLKIAFLFLGVMFTIANTVRTCLQNNIPTVNVIYNAAGITGFITLQWLI